MKKFALIALFAAATFIQPTQAQQAGDTRFSFVLAPQLSWVKSDHDNIGNKGSDFGYNFGVVIDRFFGDNYAFSTGLTINTTGGKLAYPAVGTTPGYNLSYNLKYLEVPLGLKLRSEDLHRANIYGRFGLSPQINIQARDGNDKNISESVKLFDLGYHLGGGVEYSLGGRNALMLGLMFTNGFSDITKEQGFEDKSILNRLVFEFGFIF